MKTIKIIMASCVLLLVTTVVLAGELEDAEKKLNAVIVEQQFINQKKYELQYYFNLFQGKYNGLEYTKGELQKQILTLKNKSTVKEKKDTK